MFDFRETTIQKILKELREGKLSAEELIESARKNIQEKDHEIHAVLEIFDDTSHLEEYKDTELFALPYLLKDNILFKGKLATGASHILDNYHATYDAFVVEKLREAGAVAIGRTNMDEMAMGSSTENSFYGKTRNPLDLERSPGGSSGGSAAAVAAGMVPFALGSDTGGSIRQPASFCGIVGLKPTYGAVSRNGLIAMASSLDVIGPLTHSVDDAERIFSVLAQYDPFDASSVPLDRRARFQEKNENKKIIGIPKSFLEMDGIQKEVLENFYRQIEKMKSLGYQIIDIDIPLLDYALALYYIIQPAEVSSNMARYDGIRYGLSLDGEDRIEAYKRTRSEGFGAEVKRRIMLGTYVLSSGYHDAYYRKAEALRNLLRKEIFKAFERVDIIATPTTPSVAFKFGEKQDPLSMYLEDIFTVPYNLTGNPAISIPSGKSREGLPFGMHFAAPLFCEKKLFEVSKDFESLI